MPIQSDIIRVCEKIIFIRFFYILAPPTTTLMRVGVLFSGGKDSVLAMHRAAAFHEIACLITLISSNPHSYMFHTPAIEHTRHQSQALGIPQVAVQTTGRKEREVRDLQHAIQKATEEYNIEGVVSGAIDSIYQATRIQRVCYNLNLWCYNPLWQEDQGTVLREMLSKGYKAMIVGVFGYPLGEEYLGRVIDDEVVRHLLKLREEMGFNPAGEGGEIETFVFDGPLFKRPVIIKSVKRHFSNYTGTVEMETEVEV